MRLNAIALTLCIAAAPSLAAADPSPAAGAEVVATAAGQPASPSATGDSSLSRWLDDAAPATDQSGEDGGGVITLGPDRRVHGEVGFGIGTGGYRDAYAAVSMPVGETGRLGVAVEDAQMSRPWRYERRSLDVDLSLGRGTAAPADCGTLLRVDGRDVRPLWVSNFHGSGSALADVDPRCARDAATPR